MKTLLSLSLLFIALTLNAAQPSLEKSCTKFYERTEALNYYRQFLKPDSCFVSVSPRDTISMVFRSYLFSNTGAFLVFNSYGIGDDALTTGARVYYFFPRKNIPDQKRSGNTFTVSTSAPQTSFTFDGKAGVISKIENSMFTEDPQINPNNEGGFEIKSHHGLMLDVGFARGHDPALDRDRIVKFQDHKGTQCTMTAEEIFTYKNGDIQLPNDKDLKKFLKTACPDIETLF